MVIIPSLSVAKVIILSEAIIPKLFYTGYVYSDFMFFFDRLEIILGGEGGYLDWFFIRLLARDPPSEVGSMQR